MRQDADLVLLAGDLVNDCTPEQLTWIRTYIAEVLPDTPVLAFAGNRDYPYSPVRRSARGSVIIHFWKRGCWDGNSVLQNWTAAVPGQLV